jgi:DNA-binding transcriptional LysR family regulator
LLPVPSAKMQAVDWNDLRYILTLSRAGTLAAAARRLNVNPTTVARRLDAVQRALGARLFDHVDGAFHPTKAGEAAIAHAARMEQDIAALESGVHNIDDKVSGTVRLTAVPVLINRLVVPALPALQARHPGLRLDLVADSRNASLTRREADVALRLARPETGRSVLARRLGQLDYAVYGTRDGSPSRLPWITYEEGLAHLPQARWIEAASRGEPMAPLAVNDAEALLQAVSAGLGKSLLPCFVADGATGLRRLSGAKAVLSREVWLLTHAELRRQARMTAVVDWLGDLVKARLRPKAASR